ncbi:aspartic peptidase domain-containing protein [Mycena epipterygia]|nr:aspartic peptidase domain-containing protein [Mycena epipterygia]
MAFLLLLKPVVAALAAADPIHIPISRSTGRPRTTDDHVVDAELTRRRYSFHGSAEELHRSINKRASTQDFPLVDQGVDSAYYCTVSIGTPEQFFNLLVDTAASDLWVADSSCDTGCTSSTRLYNPTLSSSSVQGTTASLTYGLETVSGTAMTDTIRLGPFSAVSQVFLGANQLPSNAVTGSVSGFLGLAFQGTLSPGLPFFQTILNSGQLASGEMSFWLNRFAGKTGVQEEEPNGGAFTLGGSNATLYSGAIDFVTVAEPPSAPTYWMVHLSAVTVQGKSVPITAGASALATFNPASGLIGGPTADVLAIWAAVPNSIPNANHPVFFQFPCSTNLIVDVSFGGRSWPINPVDLNLGPISTGSSDCLGAIYELGTTLSQTSPNWVFGAAFMINVYSVFRMNPFSIGFAQLSSKALGASSPSGQPTSAPTSFTPNPQKSGSSIPVGPIAGGAAGFVVVVVIAILWWRVCSRRRLKGLTKSPKSTTTPETPTVLHKQGRPSSPVKEFSSSSVTSSRVDPPPLASLANTAAAGGYLGVPSQTPDMLHLASGFGPSQQGPWSGTSHSSAPGHQEQIEEIPRAAEADAFRRRATPSSFNSELSSPPASEMSAPTSSHQTYSPSASPLMLSLSDMKRDQIAAAHHYGALHTPDDVLVRTSDGLQLSPGFTAQRHGPWPTIGRPMGSALGNEPRQVRRTSDTDAATSLSDTQEVHEEDQDLPPVYSR